MKIYCHYGNNNKFTIGIKHSIEYGQLYNIVARILNIKDTQIGMLIYENELIGSKKRRYEDLINIWDNEANVYIIIGSANTNYLQYSRGDDKHIIINDPSYLYIPIKTKLLNDEDKTNSCFCGTKLCDNYHDTIGLLECNHMFHETCLKEYFSIKLKVLCPICTI